MVVFSLTFSRSGPETAGPELETSEMPGAQLLADEGLTINRNRKENCLFQWR